MTPRQITPEDVRAAANADWQQVVWNGGPPCFHRDGERFCLRAERWQGHPAIHDFTSLADFLNQRLAADEDKEIMSAAALAWERLKLPSFVVAGYLDGRMTNWSVPETLRIVAARLATLPQEKA